MFSFFLPSFVAIMIFVKMWCPWRDSSESKERTSPVRNADRGPECASSSCARTNTHMAIWLPNRLEDGCLVF